MALFRGERERVGAGMGWGCGWGASIGTTHGGGDGGVEEDEALVLVDGGARLRLPARRVRQLKGRQRPLGVAAPRLPGPDRAGGQGS